MSKRAYERRIKRKREEEKRARRRHRRMRTLTIWGVAVAVVGLGLGLGLALTGGSSKPAAAPTPSASPGVPITGCTDPGAVSPKTVSFKSPPQTIDKKKRYTAVMRTTCGTIRVALDPALAPKTVNSFVFLARKGFYDKTIFHRVQNEATFAIVQGGDPKGDGTGGPGYQYGGEKPAASAKYLRGVVAMANSGDPSSNGSQFFFVVHDWPDLPANYTIFGKVTDAPSLAVLDRMIQAQGSQIGNGLGIRPQPSIEITKVTIEES
jgi:peptidyl-prolyl cis-trans isomerase B (cyclophilin B)